MGLTRTMMSEKSGHNGGGRKAKQHNRESVVEFRTYFYQHKGDCRKTTQKVFDV